MENKRREIYKDNFAEYLLCLALDVGEGMLKNGGEVSRVEDTIERICHAYGAVHVEVFSIISMISASVRMPDGSYSSQIRRVKNTFTDLSSLEMLNALSREVCATKPPLEELDERIHKIRSSRTYRWWVTLIATIVIAVSFTFFFGGGIFDALVAVFIGAAISLFEIFPSKYINGMAKIALSSFVIAMMTGIAVLILPKNTLNVDAIIIGSIMFLVPGLAFGTAMRDLLCGDLASGSLKTLQAVLQALMIALGYMAAFVLVTKGIDGGVVNTGVESGFFTWRLLIQLVTSALGSIAFSVIFRVMRRHLICIGLVGILTYFVYYTVIYFDNSAHFLAALASTAFAALFAEIYARVRRAPVIVLLSPAIIPIVPGADLYRTMKNLLMGNTAESFTYLGIALAIALGIAMGIVTVSITCRMIFDAIAKSKQKIKSNK